MKVKSPLVDMVVLAALAASLLLVVVNHLPMGLGSFRFLWGPMVLIVAVFTRPNILVNGPMKWVLLYGLFHLLILSHTLWIFTPERHYNQLLDEFYWLVFVTAVWSYYWLNRDLETLSKVSMWAFVFLLITMFTTNIALNYDPYVVRQAANPEYFSTLQEGVFNLYGAAGYGYAQSFVFLIPLLVYKIKKKQNLIFPWWILIPILAALLFTTARTQVFANFATALIITALALLGFKNRRKTYVAVIILGVIVVLTPPVLYSSIIHNVSQYFTQGSDIQNKLTEVAMSIEYERVDETSEVGIRASRYPMLLEALLASPFKGDASYKSPYSIAPGFHIWWMFKLTVWGIPGFLFFVFVLYKIFESIASALKDSEIRFYYFLSVLAFVIIGLMKNIHGREPWLMLIVVIPGLYYLSILKDEKENKKSIKKNKK